MTRQYKNAFNGLRTLRQVAFGAALLAGLTLAAPVYAIDFGGDKPSHEDFSKMTPEQREKFREERKAKWDALSDAEKVKVIEGRRAQRRKAMDEKWGSMSDNEKVKFVEEKMKRRHDRRGERREGSAEEYGRHGAMGE